MHLLLAWVAGVGGVLLDGRWWLAVVAVCGGDWWVVGRLCWWTCSLLVGCDVLWMLFVGAGGGARLLLVGDGDGHLPPFVLPRCVLAFTLGGGWWWMLVLTLVHITLLCTPIGGRCLALFVSPH